MGVRVKVPAGAGKKLCKIFPVEKLLRPAKGLAKGERVVGRKTAVEGIKQPSKMVRKVSQNKAWRDAARERDKLYRKLTDEARAKAASYGGKADDYLPRGKNTVVTGVTDPSTGLSAAGHNFRAGGGWGCAEKMALDNLNAARKARGLPPLEPHQVDFGTASSVRTAVDPPGSEKPICRAWCQAKTNPEQFPNGIRYQTDGPWDVLLRTRKRL